MPRKKKSQYYERVEIPVRIIEAEPYRFRPFKAMLSSLLVLLLILIQTNVFCAFEAHIISVTATIESGIANYLVINKVYYDVDEEHGTESKNEWIELYNPTDQEINLKNWQICNREECRIIHPNNINIPAFGYALLSHDNTTWTKYWDVPGDVVTVNLGAAPKDGWLDNDADMLILKDPDGNIIDQMNWGIPNASWINYNSDIWDPGVDDVIEGRMIGRSPNGWDTNKPEDWIEFSAPIVTVLVPNGGQIWWVGRTYSLEWSAVNPSGDDSDLSIDIYYSNNSGRDWANIVMDTENDGQYDWRVPLFLGLMYTPSDKARIKVVATNNNNFMASAWDMSDDDFCPPIDYNLLTPEEWAYIQNMVSPFDFEILIGFGDADSILESLNTTTSPLDAVTPALDGFKDNPGKLE